MSNPRPKPTADPSPAPEKFEELLGRLEQIVGDMEGADLPLEKLLSSYEEGMRLVKACGDRLTDAEQKVEILSRAAAMPSNPGSSGPSPVATPLAATGDTNLAPSPKEEDEDEDDDDIRLI